MPHLSDEVFELVDRIAAAATASQVWDTYLSASQQVGLPYGGAYFLPGSYHPPPQVVAEALPKHWRQEYQEQNLQAGDLLRERIAGSTASFQWRMSDWDPATLTPIQKRWHAHNLEHNLDGGFCILDFRHNENMVLIPCGPDGPMTPHDKKALMFAGHEAAQRLRELAVTVPMAYAPLSRRERECLQWAAAGKTDWEIGHILGLSEKTVNVYIERVKTKYNANTRARAIALAMRDGIIAA